MTPSSHFKDILFKLKPDNQTSRKPGCLDLPESDTPRKQRLIASLSRYLAIVGVYMLGMVILKVVELSAMGTDAVSGQIWVNALVFNLIVVSWEALIIGILFFLIRLLSERSAVVTTAVLYAVLLLSEVGLTLYVAHNGFLLGCELMARPFGETVLAIKGAMGVVLPIVLVVVVTGGLTALSLWRAKQPSRAVWAVAAVVGLLIVLSLMFKMSHLVADRYRQYILNKTLYLLEDCRVYVHQSRLNPENGDTIEYNGQYISELLATHPEWGTPIDPLYPLERTTPADTFLAPYFHASATPPNIIIILVESLGAEIMESHAMPFVDSLAATGLYWRNCLSTTMRSYGAVPAITGSAGGPRSFQFGVMPDHNSLFSLLKSAGYNTRAYYVGDFHFDCIYEYLTAQRIDYLSPMFEEFTTSPSRTTDNWWGYNDDTLFARTFQDLKVFSRQAHATPHLSLVTTMTMHETLRLQDKDLQKEYEQRAARIVLPPSCERLEELLPACLFTDDCLRRFINSCRSLPGYENTLFVITGDHASGRKTGDNLSAHHVPLILWSPLIHRPAAFSHMVTHNDIAPALYSLLTTHYGLPAQPTVHWLGDGLGPSPKTLVVVNYIHMIQNIVFRNYYYQPANNFLSEEFCTIAPDLTLHPCTDTAALRTCRRQIEILRYLYSYTYLTNHLTAHPVSNLQYTTANIYLSNNDVLCVTPDDESSYREQTVFPLTQLRASQGFSTVRVTVEADATVDGDMSMEQFHSLGFIFSGDNVNVYDDPLYRNFSKGRHVSITKEFPLSATKANTLKITLHPPTSAKDWLPGSSTTLSNVKITVEYGK